MSLSCSCDYDEWDPEPGTWHYSFYDKDLDFEPLNTSKRKRCSSCGALIDIGALCIKFPRYRYPYTSIEAKILHDDEFFEMNYPPEIKMSDHYHCEQCGEIYFNLTELGFTCIVPCENMPKLLKEYKENYMPLV